VPSPAARIGVPIGAAMSMPLCAFQTLNTGCTRIEKPDEMRVNATGDFRKAFFSDLPSRL
jgi:hypothetical protein